MSRRQPVHDSRILCLENTGLKQSSPSLQCISMYGQPGAAADTLTEYNCSEQGDISAVGMTPSQQPRKNQKHQRRILSGMATASSSYRKLPIRASQRPLDHRPRGMPQAMEQ